MSEFAYDDPLLGPTILTFDGHVVELFTEREGSSCRLIVSMLHIQIEDPDRKERRDVWFSAGTNRRGGGFRLVLPAEEWEGFGLWLEHVIIALG